MDLARELTDFLGAVEERLSSTLVDGNAGPDVKGDTLMEAARHLCLGSGGKRARPMLVRLFGRRGGRGHVPPRPAHGECALGQHRGGDER